MGTNFIDFLFGLVPPRLSENELERAWVTAVGQVLNAIADNAAYAVRCRFIGDAPSDALAFLGNDRLLVRGPSETDASWRARLFNAWDTHVLGGTSAGIIEALKSYGYDGAGAFYDLDVDVLGTQYFADNRRTYNWSRFWTILPEGTHGFSYSDTVPTSDILMLQKLIDRWRPAEQVCLEIIMVNGYLCDWPRPTLAEAEAQGVTVGDCWAFYIQGYGGTTVTKKN